ncbi:unnamed protein product [Meganyctiphanes norvegica]|uniref:C2H2-type domain-containing protein n=1 Tax=Meganyctiphanes norvegica TaxID=48144 RepID=A0AAV2SGS2_MEGNR
MADVSFSVEQFIKQELNEVNNFLDGVKKESFMPETVKCSPMNGEYALDLNSPEFDLQNIATESPVTYKKGEIFSPKTEELRQKIKVEIGTNIENEENNRLSGSARKFESINLNKFKSNFLNKENTSYSLDKVKIEPLNKENTSYSLDKVKIEPMSNESEKIEYNILIKEEKMISDVTHLYSEEPNCNALQNNPNIRINVLSKNCNDNSGKKKKNSKSMSDTFSKTKVNKPVNKVFDQESTKFGSSIPKTGVSSYECPYCGYKCKYEAIFQDHMLSHQNVGLKKILQFRCDLCNFQCSFKYMYDVHMNKGHDASKMIKCFKCSYKNTCLTQFNSHLAETGHKAFKCPECDLEFDTKMDMKRHLIDHEIKVVECPECKKVMKYKNYKRHLLTHEKPLECSICGYRAAGIKRMRDHMLIHSDEKPYECEVCKKTFRQDQHLKRHMPSHQNRDSRKLFECGVCKKTYTLNQTLKQHYKKSNHGPKMIPFELL